MSGDAEFRLRQAARVFHWPARPSPRWRPPKCAACRLPISEKSQVVDVANMGWCHAYCSEGLRSEE